MKFRTEYIPLPAERPLDPGRPLLLAGSCFTDSIGRLMRRSRWRAYHNICGVLYNPFSIADMLDLAVMSLEGPVTDIIRESITTRGDLSMTWFADSSVTTFSAEDTLNKFEGLVRKSGELLTESQALISTFGTAWVYELTGKPGTVVANCHKFPADTFTRRRLSQDEIAERWKGTVSMLHRINPGLRIIFTVSPIRHLKDGFEGNMRSKATLLLACEKICGETENTEYFPAYEILNDDLRDYRFYDEDLVHPSQAAAEYIWDKFRERYLSRESNEILREGEKVTRLLSHRPIIGDGTDNRMLAEHKERARVVYEDFMRKHPGMLPLE